MPVKECVREPQEGDYIDEYGKNHGPGVRIGETVWAIVNCGYHKEDFKFGKIYQWGRKYGQGYDGPLNDMYSEYLGHYSDASLPEISQGPVTLPDGQSPTNADVFYAGAPEFNYDWVYQQNGRLWNAGSESNPVKTEYDPCPAGWRVPTFTEYKELLGSYYFSHRNNESCCYRFYDSSWSSYIDLIAAGNLDRRDGQSYNRGSHGCYWTSSGNDNYSINVYFSSDNINLYYDYYGRADGYSVRCVKDYRELIPVESITLEKTALTLEAGCVEYVPPTILPIEANNWFAHWWSENPQIASVDKYGNITGVSEGVTVITAMAGMQMTTCEVTVTPASQSADYIDEYGINHGPGIEIDGVVWAPVNCGYHATDFQYGKLYQWGRKYGQGYDGPLYDVNNIQTGTYSDSFLPSRIEGPVSLSTGQAESNSNIFYTFSAYYLPCDWVDPQDAKLWNSGTEDDPFKTEYDPCPEGWRVPTYAELDNLTSSSSSWTTDGGQVGYWFSGISSYSESVTRVFFPAAGSRYYYDGNAKSRGESGHYWASSSNGLDANNLYIHSNSYLLTRGARAYGYSVRCVRE